MAKLSWFWSQSIITPITAALFIIVAFTGILLLFHAGGGTTKEIHELLSVAFVIGAILHLALNWRIFACYLKKPVTIGLGVAVIAVLAATLGGGSEGAGGSPVKEMFGLVERAPLTHFAPLVGVQPTEAMAILQKEGLTVSGESQTIGDIARSNGRRTPEILALFRATGPSDDHQESRTR